MFELHPGHPRAYRALAANLSNHGHYGEAALLLEEAMEAHPGTEPFPVWHAWSLFIMGLYDEAAKQGQDVVTAWVLMAQDRMEEARALIQKGLEEEPDEYWMWAEQTYYDVMRKELGVEPIKSSVARQLEWMENKGIPWREQCHPYLIYDMRLAGVEDGVDDMMEECRKRTEERLKAGYLCPCTFFNLVLFASLDGRTDDAIERAMQWVDNGDSFSWLSADPILQEWSDRPEYEQLLIRNAEQVQKQQRIYFTGKDARDRNKQASSP